MNWCSFQSRMTSSSFLPCSCTPCSLIIRFQALVRLHFHIFCKILQLSIKRWWLIQDNYKIFFSFMFYRFTISYYFFQILAYTLRFTFNEILLYRRKTLWRFSLSSSPTCSFFKHLLTFLKFLHASHTLSAFRDIVVPKKRSMIDSRLS